SAFALLLLEAANHLERPQPLPLAGVRSLAGMEPAESEPTTIAAEGPAADHGEAEGTGRWRQAGAATSGLAVGAALAGSQVASDPDPSDGIDVPAWVRGGDSGTTVLRIDESDGFDGPRTARTAVIEQGTPDAAGGDGSGAGAGLPGADALGGPGGRKGRRAAKKQRKELAAVTSASEVRPEP